MAPKGPTVQGVLRFPEVLQFRGSPRQHWGSHSTRRAPGRAGGPATPGEGPTAPRVSQAGLEAPLSPLEPEPEQPPCCHLPALTHGLPRRQALLAAGR